MSVFQDKQYKYTHIKNKSSEENNSQKLFINQQELQTKNNYLGLSQHHQYQKDKIIKTDLQHSLQQIHLECHVLKQKTNQSGTYQSTQNFSSLGQLMRQQLELIVQRYQQRLQESNYKHKLQQQQLINKINNKLQNNENELIKKQKIIQQLKNQLQRNNKFNNDKIDKVQNQLKSIKKYYQQCYQYTLRRISDIDIKISIINGVISNIGNSNKIIDYTNQIKKFTFQIIGRYMMDNIDYKTQIQSQIDTNYQYIENLVNNISQLTYQGINLKNFCLKQQSFHDFLDTFRQSCIQNTVIQVDQVEISAMLKEKTIKKVNERINYLQIQVQQIQKNLNNIIQNNEKQKQSLKSDRDKLEDTIIQLKQQKDLLEKKLARLEQSTNFKDYRKQEQLKLIIQQLQKQNKQLNQLLTQKTVQYQEKIKDMEIFLQGIQQDFDKSNKTVLKQSSLSFGQDSQEDWLKINTPKFSQRNQTQKYSKENNLKYQQIIKNLKNKIKQLEQINNTFTDQNQKLKQQLKQLNQDYHSYIKNFQSQSLAFQKITELLRKQNEKIKKQKEQLHKKISQVKQQITRQHCNKINKSYSNQFKKSTILHNQSRQKPLNNTLCQDSQLIKSVRTSRMNVTCNHFSMQKRLDKSQQKNKNKNQVLYTYRTAASQSRIAERPQFNQIQILKNVIELNNYKMPVPCIIDRTGYLKHSENHTYFLDDNGSLFKLTKQQQQIAKKHRIISIK